MACICYMLKKMSFLLSSLPNYSLQNSIQPEFSIAISPSSMICQAGFNTINSLLAILPSLTLLGHTLLPLP